MTRKTCQTGINVAATIMIPDRLRRESVGLHDVRAPN